MPRRHELAELVSKIPNYIVIAGSYRRGLDPVDDLDLIVREPFRADADRWLNEMNFMEKTGGTHIRHGMINGVKVDVLYTAENVFAYALLHFTGSKTHNIVMRAKLKKQGLTLNQYGIFRNNIQVGPIGKNVTERDIFDYVGIKYKNPRLR